MNVENSPITQIISQIQKETEENKETVLFNASDDDEFGDDK